MSADPRIIRARLLSGLDDALAIETRPIGEVRAALEEMGVDPEASIRLAQKLAQGADADPATRLLQQVERAEDIDAEIAALEEASIDEVRAALPAGLETSAAAVQQNPDHEAASLDDRRARRRRRLSTLGWGGSLIGIAASVVLFIAVRPDRIDQAGAPVLQVESAPDVAMEAESTDREMAGQIAPAERRARALEEDLSRLQAARPSKGEGAAKERFDAEDGSAAMADAVQALAGRSDQALASDDPSRLALRPDFALDEAEPSALVDRRTTLSARVSAKAAASDLPPLPDDIEAIFIVEEAAAPSELLALVDALPEGRLATRLDEARRVAAGRSVIALITFLREGRTVEAVLVEPATSHASRGDLSTESTANLSALVERDPVLPSVTETSLELIELPHER